MPGFPVLGDLMLSDDGRELVLISGREKIAQSIRVGAQIFRGSWRYDRQRGVPYFQDILVTGPQLELVRRRFYEFLSETDGVLSVESVTVRLERDGQGGATAYVDFRVVCETGDLLFDTLDFALLQ